MSYESMAAYKSCRDVESRVHSKIMEHGSDAIYYFAQDEFEYYSRYVEPVILLQVRANLQSITPGSVN
jgi:hypothetical protein